MSETLQRLLALEAHVQVLTKRLEETAATIPAGVGPGIQVPDYANYKGPFMVGLLASGYVKVGAGYILAPGGAYAYGGGTGGALAAGTNYVTLKIVLAGGAVSTVAVEIKTTLSAITSTGTEKQVLIAVVKCEGGKPVGRVQEQRGNIVVESGTPVLDIIVTNAMLGGVAYMELPIGLDELYPTTSTIVKRYGHAATYEVNVTPGGSPPYAIRNTVKFLKPKAMYRVTLHGTFLKTAYTATDELQLPEIRICKGASSSGGAGTAEIHALTVKQSVFQEEPEGWLGATTAFLTGILHPKTNTFRDHFSISTLVVPEDDLTDDTLSLWGKGERQVHYELLIEEIPGAQYDAD